MDKFDHKIIDILRHNARLSVTEIAEKVNLSRSAVTARIRKLENDKVILGYHAEIAALEGGFDLCLLRIEIRHIHIILLL